MNEQDLFSNPDSEPSLFASVSEEVPAPVAANRTTARLLSIAESPNTTVAAGASEVDAAEAKLSAGQEYAARLKIAADRQKRQMQSVDRTFRNLPSNIVSKEAQAQTSAIYNALASQRIEDNAKASIEREAIDRIHDDLGSGNAVEAKITYDLMFGRGNATKVWFDEAAKNLVLAQAVERYRKEEADETWGGWAWNMASYIIPFNYNFSRAGVVDGPNTGGLKNFLLSGTGMAAQSDEFFSKYWNGRTPEELAASLETGGELDQSLRSNSTTLGGYAPGNAADLLTALNYQSESDRAWANGFGLAEAAFVMPWGKVGSLAKGMTRLGSRSGAVRAVANAAEELIANGPKAADRAAAMSEREVVENMELSTMTPSAATPNSVPLGVDVGTRVAAARDFLTQNADQVLQATRATSPDEIALAYETAVKNIEKQTGRGVKDVRYMTEDLSTGVTSEYKLYDPLPAQGNVVHFVEVTFGKKSGGLFATQKSALSEAINRLGIRGTAFEAEAATRVNIDNVEAGFASRAYHGTSGAFDEISPAMAGKTTGAENTRGGVTFFSDDPKVAESYGRIAAAKANQQEFNEAQAAFRADPSDANADRFEAAIERVGDDAGQNVRPVDMDTSNYAEYDMAGRAYNGPETQAIIDKARADGKSGVIFRNYDDDALDGRVSTTYAVFDQSTVRSQFAPKIVRDVSGGWAVKARFNVSEEGFITSELNTPSNGFFGPLRSVARRLDRDAQVKAVAGGATADRMQKMLTQRIKDSLKGINKDERVILDEIIRKGQNSDRWWTDDEFRILYERGAKSQPTDKVLNAYHEYQFVNDIEYVMRNDELYKSRATKGYETVKFEIGQTGLVYDDIARVKIGGQKPTERVFNATDGVHYNSQRPLSQDEWERLSGEGYVLVTTDGIKFPDGLQLRQILIHRSELERSALRREQLGYKAGGHRAYTGRYFIKQTAGGVQPDTGGAYLRNPNVFRTGNNPNRLRAWADVFNRAIDDAARGIRDPQHFDDNVFANGRGLSFPSGEDFVAAVERGDVDLKHRVEVLSDRELPKEYYNARNDVDRFIDTDETAVGGYYRTTGRMYTSKRGEHLLDESGEFAETVDPWEATNQALANISRTSSMGAYKENVLQRFKATYGAYVDVRNLETASPMDIIQAPVRRDVPERLAKLIRAEQSGFAHIMNFESGFEKQLRHSTENLARWVLGDAEGGWKEQASNAVYWIARNNPVNTLRGIAFDAKLGLFNPGQFFLQASTMLAATSLSPAAGLKGMFGSAPMYAFVKSGYKEGVLDVLAKRGVWKTASFASEQEFKDFARFMKDTGFLDIGGSQAMISNFGPNRVYGAASKIDAVREAGRVLFYSSEIFNRSVAGRIAWEELKQAGETVGSASFRERFIGLADDYSMNMTSESSAVFQKGLWSIPTQFWGYNVRMMDAMFGNRFTAAQRRRLVFSQFALYGTAGVPVADAVGEYLKIRNPEPIEVGTLQSVLDRGLLDNALAAISGADVRVGERIGSGQFLTDTIKNTGLGDVANSISSGVGIGDIFSINEFNHTSLVETAGGATASITGAGLKTIRDAVKYAAAESGSEMGYQITRENLLKIADNVSTVSGIHKAILLKNYGIYRSNTGSIQANDLPAADAFFVAMSLGRPQELDDLAVLSDYTKREKEIVTEATKLVRNWRQEAFTVPSKFDENAAKVNFYIQLLPANIRKQVLQQTNRTMDKSFYDHVQKQYEKDKMNGRFDRDAE